MLVSGVWSFAIIVFALNCAVSAAEPVPGDEILVSNNKASVSRAEFEADISRIPEKDRTEFLASRERIGKALEDILVTKTLAAEARELRLDKSPEMQIKLRLAEDKLLGNARLENLEQTAAIPDMVARAEELYKQNLDKYTTKATVHAEQIMISTNDRTKQEALKRAEEVRALAAGGKSFEDLAVEYSDDKTAKESKGDLGYFAPERMVKPVAGAIIALNVGEISEPIESKFGYHIIKILDKKPAVVRSYDSVKDKIINELRDQYISDLRSGKVNAIRTGSDMKINEEAILRLKTTLPYAGDNDK